MAAKFPWNLTEEDNDEDGGPAGAGLDWTPEEDYEHLIHLGLSDDEVSEVAALVPPDLAAGLDVRQRMIAVSALAQSVRDPEIATVIYSLTPQLSAAMSDERGEVVARALVEVAFATVLLRARRKGKRDGDDVVLRLSPMFQGEGELLANAAQAVLEGTPIDEPRTLGNMPVSMLAKADQLEAAQAEYRAANPDEGLLLAAEVAADAAVFDLDRPFSFDDVPNPLEE